jgi:hypothetical protein
MLQIKASLLYIIDFRKIISLLVYLITNANIVANSKSLLTFGRMLDNSLKGDTYLRFIRIDINS